MDSFVRVAALTNFAEVVGALGYNADAAMRRVGLSPRVLKEPELRLPSDTVVRLLEEAARDTGCETIGLRMAQLRQLSHFGAVSLVLAHQASLRGILTTTIEHLHLLNNSLALQVEDAGPLVIVREEVMSALPARQSIELAIGVIYRLCAALMGDGWRPQSVGFSHAAPASMAVHHQVFRCPVVFDADFNGMVFRAADLDLPNASVDPSLARYAKTLLEALPSLDGGSVGREVRRAIYLMLPSGCATCEWVAQSLGRSLRTLQRELDEEGTSFTALLAEVRQNLARRYIENPRYSLGHVAELLGYSTHSAFTRWFTLQFGQSPAAWRRQAMAPGLKRATAAGTARPPSARRPAAARPGRERAAR
jgi:AraC-like DNA-binding protein